MEEVLRSQRRRPNVGSPERTEDYIQQLRANVARGGNPLHARNPELAAKGILKAQVTQRIPYEKMPEAYLASETGHARGKVVVIVP